MPSFRHRPRVLAVPGLDGVAWLIACDRSRECVVVDAHLAHHAVASLVAEAGLTVVASLGTAGLPTPPQPEQNYSRLLADLGLTPVVEPLRARIEIGPVPAWDGTTVAKVGNRLVEFGDETHGALVFVESSVITDPLQLTVSSLLVRFGSLCAVGSPREIAPAGTLAWRVNDQVFVSRRGAVEPLDLAVHGTSEWSPDEAALVWGEHAVRFIDACDLGLLDDLQILDLEHVSSKAPRVAGARRVGTGWKSRDLGLDPWREVLLVSADGLACADTADQLADVGYRVLRFRGGARKWALEGLPLARSHELDDEELSLDGEFGVLAGS